MKKETKKWWIVTAANEVLHTVADDYYNEMVLVEKSIPFWGTHDELLQFVKQKCFTSEEATLLKTGWQAFEKFAIILNGSKRREPNWKWGGTFKKQVFEGEGWFYGWLKEGDLEPEEKLEAPWFKHKFLLNLDEQEIYLRMRRGNEPKGNSNLWTKTIKIICLEQGGSTNDTLAKSVVAEIGKFINELQNAIK